MENAVTSRELRERILKVLDEKFDSHDEPRAALIQKWISGTVRLDYYRRHHRRRLLKRIQKYAEVLASIRQKHEADAQNPNRG